MTVDTKRVDKLASVNKAAVTVLVGVNISVNASVNSKKPYIIYIYYILLLLLTLI